MSQEGDREAFEKWARGEGINLFQNQTGVYFHSPANPCWRAWQAARATPVVNREDVRDELRGAINAEWSKRGKCVGTGYDFFADGYQAATASAEAKYLPVIEKLVYGIKNYQARLQDFANDGEPQYKVMLDDAERTLDEALAEAAPLLRGKI